jgi:hypothetical protein
VTSPTLTASLDELSGIRSRETRANDCSILLFTRSGYDPIAQNGFIYGWQMLGTSTRNDDSRRGHTWRKGGSQLTVTAAIRDRTAKKIVAVRTVGICFLQNFWLTTITLAG